MTLPKDTETCSSCGAQTMICSHCRRIYCPCCDLHHVQEDSKGELYWGCDYFDGLPNDSYTGHRYDNSAATPVDDAGDWVPWIYA
ncbi:hypothetical protein KSB_52070 [Ktedonobacter robiniae]|uniref:B box-type domain-containing protein n=1 Tax=Ktedonobacter robiniae TaxID=2778365 RepID=A0ABQ3UVW9_9CHLR|nr:hypothetical protein KSB_52070 [Ktedonobacter robiniae]